MCAFRGLPRERVPFSQLAWTSIREGVVIVGKKAEPETSTPARAADAKTAEAPAQAGGMNMKKKLVTVFGILGLVGVGLAIGMFIVPMMKKSPESAEKKPSSTTEQIAGDATAKGEESTKPAEGATPAAEADKFVFDFKKNFITNLLDPSGRQMIQMTIQVEANSADGKAAIEKNEVRLRHATNILLNGKTLAELQGPGGMDRLTNELRARYEGVMEKPGAIKEISYADLMFVKQ